MLHIYVTLLCEIEPMVFFYSIICIIIVSYYILKVSKKKYCWRLLSEIVEDTFIKSLSELDTHACKPYNNFNLLHHSVEKKHVLENLQFEVSKYVELCRKFCTQIESVIHLKFNISRHYTVNDVSSVTFYLRLLYNGFRRILLYR